MTFKRTALLMTLFILIVIVGQTALAYKDDARSHEELDGRMLAGVVHLGDKLWLIIHPIDRLNPPQVWFGGRRWFEPDFLEQVSEESHIPPSCHHLDGGRRCMRVVQVAQRQSQDPGTLALCQRIHNRHVGGVARFSQDPLERRVVATDQ